MTIRGLGRAWLVAVAAIAMLATTLATMLVLGASAGPADAQEPQELQTIADIAVGNADLSTLVTALTVATEAGSFDFFGAVSDPNADLTMFAPTNDAFAALGSDLDVALADPGGMLTTVLAYHLLDSSESAAELVAAGVLTSLQGTDITIEIRDGNVFVNESMVTIADIEASNGIVHVVDAVLAPPAPTPEVTPVPTPAGVCVTKVFGGVDDFLPCVNAEGASVHLRALQGIADANGGTRQSGSAGYDQSAGYVAGLLEAAGLRVERQQFDFSVYSEESVSLSVDGADVETTTMSYSGSASVADGNIVAVDLDLGLDNSSTSGCEAEDFEGLDFSGDADIALMQRGACAFSTKAANAGAAGAEAAIIFNQGNTEDRVDIIDATLSETFALRVLPVLDVSYADGVMLSEALSVSLSAVTDVVTTTTENVIADLAGVNADNVVMAGAHLDSVDEGAGIQDNGSGSAVLLTVALALANNETYVPQNTLRFAWWGAEEAGLIGSTKYVSDPDFGLSGEEQAALAAYINFDMVASPNFIYGVYDADESSFEASAPVPEGSVALEDLFEAYYSDNGIPYDDSAFSGRSDYQAFIDVDIPSSGLFTGAEVIKTDEQAAIWSGTAGEQFDPCYHEACDTFDNVSQEALEVNVDAVAYAILHLAASTEAVNAVVGVELDGRTAADVTIAGPEGTFREEPEPEPEIDENQRPFITHQVPGRVQAERFDNGGEGVAYSDVEPANRGNSTVRSAEGVDIFNPVNSGATSPIIGSTRSGEWTEYTVLVPEAGDYELVGRIASGFDAPGFIRARVNNTPVGTIGGSTGGWYEWRERKFGTASFHQGENVIRLAWNGGGQVNLDWIEVKPASVSLPSIIEITADDERFSTFVTALAVASDSGPVDFLAALADEEADFTVFAPTDDAFEALGDTLEAALADPSGLLTQVLGYHMLDSSEYAADLVTEQSANTLVGSPVRISLRPGGVFINDARVAMSNIAAKNGIVYVIDTVLEPPAPATCAGLAQEAEDGRVSGNFVIQSPAPSASGRAYVEAPTGSGRADGDDYAEYCVTIEEAGVYRIDVEARAFDDGSDSFFVSVDGGPMVTFDTGIRDHWFADTVSARGIAPTVRYQLDAGDHIVRFYQRDNGTQLDSLELVLTGGTPTNLR